jgi:hypothetical protein
MLGFVVVAERDFKIPFTINCCNALPVLPKLARAVLTFANSKAPPKQVAGREDVAQHLRGIFPALARHLRNFGANTCRPNGRIDSKFQFNGGGGWRTYIGFTHSAF